MPPIYILLAGKRYSGKDYIAKKLSELIPNSEIIHFADEVKYTYAERILGDRSLGDRLINDRKFKELHRKGLIELSQSEKVNGGDDIWAKRLVRGNTNKTTVLIVPDLRFRAELNSSALQGKVLKIRVVATDENRKSRGWVYDDEIDLHPSEVDLDNVPNNLFDCIIENDSDCGDSLQMILKIL